MSKVFATKTSFILLAASASLEDWLRQFSIVKLWELGMSHRSLILLQRSLSIPIVFQEQRSLPPALRCEALLL